MHYFLFKFQSSKATLSKICILTIFIKNDLQIIYSMLNFRKIILNGWQKNIIPINFIHKKTGFILTAKNNYERQKRC